MDGERGSHIPFSRKQSFALRQARHRLAAMTPSELEPVNIKWIPLTPGRAVTTAKYLATPKERRMVSCTFWRYWYDAAVRSHPLLRIGRWPPLLNLNQTRNSTGAALLYSIPGRRSQWKFSKRTSFTHINEGVPIFNWFSNQKYRLV